MPKAKGNYCNVEGCHNRSEDDRGTGRHYYRLPAVIYNQGQECENLSAERRRLWLAALNQDFTGKNLANVRVCSDHFVNKKADLYQRDSPDWVPSINMSSKQRSEADLKTPAVIARYLRKVKRRKESTAARALLDLSQSDSPMTREVGCQCNTPVLKSVAVQAVLAPKKPKRRSKAIQVRPLVSNCASVSCSDEDLPVKSESSFTSTSIKRPRMEDSSEETSYSSEEPTDDTHMPDIIQEEDIKLEPCDSSYIVVTI